MTVLNAIEDVVRVIRVGKLILFRDFIEEITDLLLVFDDSLLSCFDSW
jgi:hypothetical protein